jgi:hypothetical protein
VTITRDLIVQAFPQQPRMQAAFEALVNDAEAATARLTTALEAISGLSGGAGDILSELASKQPHNDTLDAISILGPDPGVLEQIQAGIFAVRPIDAADVKSLVTRELGDSRWLGQNHQAASTGKWATPRNLTGSGDVTWSLTGVDGTANVNAVTTLATVNSNTGTYGGATTSAQISVNGKGLITGVSAVTITPAFSSITGTPTTLAGYGITLTSANVTTALGYTPTSVTGLTGVQTVAAFKAGLSLVKADVGLGSVDNTADAAKAVLSATKWTTARNLAGNSVDGSANVAFANKFIVQGTADAGLSAAQFLGALGTGIVKNTTTTGVLSIAVAADFPTLNQSTTGSAATLTTGRTISITGDIAYTSPAFDGSGNITAAGTLATVNANTGTWGSATQVAQITLDGKGRATAAANVTITPAVGSITGLGTGVATALAVNVGSAGAFVTFNGAGGTPSSLTLTNATGLVLTSGVTGILPGANGGTNNGFMAFTGPATSLKTFTLPNASDTIGCLGTIQTWTAIQTFSAIPLVSGGGIKFPATQVTSADANTLDDYEEGTFTPVLRFGGASTGITYSVQTGSYTKVGREVHGEIEIRLTSKGSSTGTGDLTGLPFTCATLTAAVLTPDAMAAAVTNPRALIINATAQIFIYNFAAGAITALTDASFTNTSILFIQFSYRV